MEQVKKCCHRVYRDRWQASHCEKPAVKDGWCTIHHPDYVKVKVAARNAKWEAEYAAKEKAYEEKRAKEAAERLILQNAPVRIKVLEELVKEMDDMMLSDNDRYYTTILHERVISTLSNKGDF